MHELGLACCLRKNWFLVWLQTHQTFSCQCLCALFIKGVYRRKHAGLFVGSPPPQMSVFI